MTVRLEVLKLAFEQRFVGESDTETLERADVLLAWVEPPRPALVILPECVLCHRGIRPDETSATFKTGTLMKTVGVAHQVCLTRVRGSV